MSEAKHSPLLCPCCGSNRVIEWTNHQAVKCLDCGMNGPSKSWNTRASAVAEPEAAPPREEIAKAAFNLAEAVECSVDLDLHPLLKKRVDATKSALKAAPAK